jgi:hypothetical protein
MRYLPLLWAMVGSGVVALGAAQDAVWLEQVAEVQTTPKHKLRKQLLSATVPLSSLAQRKTAIASATAAAAPTRFLVFAGGGSPSSNEIALEKNVRYFQRTLSTFGISPTEANVFFANGTDGQATVRYIDEQGEQQFKIPEIPNLAGSSTPQNLQQWFMTASRSEDRRPLFFYFTGHGVPGGDSSENNAMVLWDNSEVSVQALAEQLERIPESVPVAMMMAQCFSGGFTNIIYEQGNPANPVSLQSRCGFFATVKTRPSLGCTPEVNEADYRDYSSSFFAGLSGVDRLGKKVGSADYNQDGKVVYSEAHAFAKVDEAAADWPVSTSEEWLQRQISDRQRAEIFSQPIKKVLKKARPEQKYVVEQLAARLKIDLNQPAQGFEILTKIPTPEEFDVTQAYGMRLRMELLNIGAEKIVRKSGDKGAIALLERLLKCEFGSWL